MYVYSLRLCVVVVKLVVAVIMSNVVGPFGVCTSASRLCQEGHKQVIRANISFKF